MTKADKEWEARFNSRKGLSMSDKLKEGDAVWMHGGWHDIPKELIGVEVRWTSAYYGVNPPPSFGRKK